MESTLEVVWKEQTNSTVSKKCVEEMSVTSIQKLSSSSMVGEKSMLSILNTDGNLRAEQISTDNMLMAAIPSPIITSPSLPEDDQVVNTKSLQSEFSSMKLKDEHGKEIGELIQQKQQQQSVQASSLETSVDGISCKSTTSVSSTGISSSVLQQTSTLVKAEAHESSSSVSCSSFSSTKKQDIATTSTTRSSIQSTQSIEKVMKSSTTAIENQNF